MAKIGICSAPNCQEYGSKTVTIPKTPGNRQDFDIIAVLCKNHFDRFEELYELKEHDFYEDAKSMA